MLQAAVASLASTTFAWDKRFTALFALSAQAAQDSATVYGGQLGINVAF